MGPSPQRMAAALAIATSVAALNGGSAAAQDGTPVLLPGIDVTDTRLVPGPGRGPVRRGPPPGGPETVTQPGPTAPRGGTGPGGTRTGGGARLRPLQPPP